jgi:hypothetical protein
MKRRRALLAIIPGLAGSTALLRAAAAESAGQTTIRGKLVTGPNPVLSVGTRQVKLSGDEPTMGVLKDDRLNGVDFEAIGAAKSQDDLAIDKIHTRSMFVHKDGKRLMVTYWCDVCYIRTYTPGICWCCQKNTDLDLRESISD